MAPYPSYPVPGDEEQRLRELERYGVIGSASDEHFERIISLAASILNTPMVAISLVEADRQWFLAHQGLPLTETPREMAFCAHAIAGDGVLVVPDASADERFRTNPLVVCEPHIRFYAGAPLQTPAGHNLGTLCLIDQRPRQPTEAQIQQLRLMADLVMRELELRRRAHLCPITGLPNRETFLEIGAREFNRARQDSHPLSLLCFDVDNFQQVNNRWGHHQGDEVLQDLCRLGRSFLTERDFAGRLGDEAFALLLVGRDQEAAFAVAEQLREDVAQMGGIFKHSDYKLHISGGFTSMGSHDQDFNDLLRRARRAMELAQNNGRNQIAILLDGV